MREVVKTNLAAWENRLWTLPDRDCVRRIVNSFDRSDFSGIVSLMTAKAVIEQIKHLPPSEQSRVIQFAVELARTRQLAGDELSALARRMVESDDPAEVEKLKSALTHGFYGN